MGRRTVCCVQSTKVWRIAPGFVLDDGLESKTQPWFLKKLCLPTLEESLVLLFEPEREIAPEGLLPLSDCCKMQLISLFLPLFLVK